MDPTTPIFLVSCDCVQRLVRRSRGAALIAVLAVGIGCSGGGTADSGGIGGSGLSQGTIDGFGSIFVNGVRWNTDAAEIVVDGARASEAELGLGMLVNVEGTFSSDGASGTATRVRAVDDLEGPISRRPTPTVPDGSVVEIEVLGILVTVEGATVVFSDETGSNFSFATMAENDVVEVHGFAEAPGRIRATRLEKKGVFVPGIPVASEFEGAVSSLDEGAGTFRVGSVLVRYDPSGVTTDLMELEEPLREGLPVEVEGTFDGSEFTATRIDDEDDDLPLSDAERVEIEGIVRNFNGLADFRVGSQAVNAAMAVVEGDVDRLVDGAKVEVEGRLVAGVLKATKVELEDGRFRVSAVIGNDGDIDAAAGTVVLLGGAIVVTVDASTRIEDDRDDVEPFSLSGLRGGDFIEVRGSRQGANGIRASQLERAREDDLRLRGALDAADAGAATVTILGVVVPTDGMTQFENENDMPIGPGAFFSAVAVGDIVEVRDDDDGDNGAIDVADEVALEERAAAAPSFAQNHATLATQAPLPGSVAAGDRLRTDTHRVDTEGAIVVRNVKRFFARIEARARRMRDRGR